MGCVCAGPPPKNEGHRVGGPVGNNNGRKQVSKGNRVGGNHSAAADARQAAAIAAEKRMAALGGKGAPGVKRKKSGTSVQRKIKTQDAIKKMEQRAERDAEVR